MQTKSIIAAFLLVIGCESLNSQNLKTGFTSIGIYASSGINRVIRSQERDIYSGSSHGLYSYSLGVNFSRAFPKKRVLEIAACFSGHYLNFEYPGYFFPESYLYRERLEILSIPVSVRQYLGKNFFLSAGIITDIGLPRYETYTDTQTGLGAVLGAGKEVSFFNFILDLSPVVEFHSVIPFSELQHNQRIFVFGLHMGIINNCK